MPENQSPVLVTGATGYVAGWLIKELLENGITVHATVRDPSNTDKLKYLNEMSKDLPGEIKYFKADLLAEGSFEEAMKDCKVVFHTASPFTLDVKDPQAELVDPAKKGTQNVLDQATKTPTVKRVVLTSSVVAIYGDNADLQDYDNQTLTEDDWNTTSSVSHQPYAYSKVQAEKLAWQIQQNQNQWDMVTINPSLVMGPGLNPKGTSESFNIIRQMGDGTFKGGVPKWGMGVVDVRDVAKAHYAAAFTKEAKGRYITSAHNTSFMGMADALRDKYGDTYPLPKSIIPKFMIWLIGPIVNKAMTRKAISRNAGYPWKADNSKSRKELGINYRSLNETMNDFFEQMITTNQI